MSDTLVSLVETLVRHASVAHRGRLGYALHTVAVCCSVLQCVAVRCSVLQCVAVCCSVLQCVAVCCSVLLCVTLLRARKTSVLVIEADSGMYCRELQ